MLSCDEALELISARLDGALSEEEKNRLEEHLSACPACRALSAELEVLHQELPQLAAQPPAGLKEGVMDRIHASKVTPFQGKKRQWRWRSLASLAAVLAIVLIGAGTMGQWRTSGMLGTGQSANSAAMPAPAAGGSEENSAGGEIAPASTGLPQTETKQTPAGSGAAEAEAGSDGQTESGGSSGGDSRSISGSGQTGAAQPTGIPQFTGGSSDAANSVTPDASGSQSDLTAAAPYSNRNTLTQTDVLYKLAAWLGWNTDELTVDEDGTITGPTGADGTTAKLICAGLNETGTGWLCQLEETAPGPDGTVSCTTYTVSLDGGEITQP